MYVRHFHSVLNNIYSAVISPLEWENIIISLEKSTDFDDYITKFLSDITDGKYTRLPQENNDIFINAIVPHLKNAKKISYRLHKKSLEVTALKFSLEKHSNAVVILDNKGHIIHLNQKAAHIHDGIIIGDNIRMVRKCDNRDFQKTLKETLTDRANYCVQEKKFFSLLRPSGKRPYSLLLRPLPLLSPALEDTEPAIMITISDPETPPKISLSSVKNNFGLTHREAELAVIMCHGQSLPDAANNLLIAYSTARTLLSRVYKKMPCNNRPDLLRLILSLPG